MSGALACVCLTCLVRLLASVCHVWCACLRLLRLHLLRLHLLRLRLLRLHLLRLHLLHLHLLRLRLLCLRLLRLHLLRVCVAPVASVSRLLRRLWLAFLCCFSFVAFLSVALRRSHHLFFCEARVVHV